MLDSDKNWQIFRDTKWLWVTNKDRAVAFIMVFSITAAITLYFTFFSPWRFLLQHIELADRVPFALKIAQKLSNNISSGTYQIILMGGSTSRELTSHDKMVSDTLSFRNGRKIRFINAADRNQNITAPWSIGDRLADNGLDMMVIGLNYYRFVEDHNALKKNIAHYRFPVPLSQSILRCNFAFLNMIPALEPVSQVGQLYAYRQYIKGVYFGKPVRQTTEVQLTTSNLFSGPRNYYRKPVFSVTQKEQRVNEFIASRGPQFYYAHLESLDLWTEFVRNMDSKGVKILFLILPLDPQMDVARSLFDPLFDPMMAKLEQAGATIVDWRNLDFLVSEDFYDQQHLVKSGRKKIFQRLIHDISLFVPQLDEAGSQEQGVK